MRLGQGEQLVEPGRVVGVQRARASARPAPGRSAAASATKSAGSCVGRLERELAAQPDRGLPDRLQQQPEPGVVDRPGVLGQRCGPPLAVSSASSRRPRSRRSSASASAAAGSARPFSVASMSAALRSRACASRTAAGQRPHLVAQAVRLGPQPGQLVAQLLGLDLGHGPLVLGPDGPVLGRVQPVGHGRAVGVDPQRLARRRRSASRQPSGRAR